MLPGPELVYKCPNCDNLIKNGSLMSGNTIGALIFSDGKRIAPMLPEFPDLTICKKCDHIFWLSKLKEIGSFNWGQNFQEQNVDDAEFLTIDEYFRALELGVPDNIEEEIFIRQRILWTFNDRVRDGEKLFNSENDNAKWKSNIDRLITILDKDEIDNKIMIAELNRALGNFDKCLTIIDGIEIPELDWLKEAFRKECNNKNQKVFQLN